MVGTQHLLAIEMSLLLTGISNGAKPGVLGIIEVADRASLSGHLVSEGTSVYDGDQLSTETRGAMQFRSGGVTLALGEESSVIVRGEPSNTGTGFTAELVSGAMTLSVAAEAAAEIQALGARIWPGANARVIMQVRILGPKELIVYARRGAVQVSYREQSEMIMEGKSYYVLLDPPDGDDSKDPTAKKPGKRGKAFVLIAVATTAVAAGIATSLALQQHYESPDRP